MTSKRKLRANIDKLFNPRLCHRSHYLKWALTDSLGGADWSIRYFWVIDSHPDYVRKWVLKSHKTKTYIILPQSLALDYIKHMAITLRPQELLSVLAGKYHRMVVQH